MDFIEYRTKNINEIATPADMEDVEDDNDYASTKVDSVVDRSDYANVDSMTSSTTEFSPFDLNFNAKTLTKAIIYSEIFSRRKGRRRR